MEWKTFFVALYNLATKDYDIKDWDSLYEKIIDNKNLKTIAYNVMRIHFGSDPKKETDWWKKFFRQLLDFTSQKRKKQKELMLMSDEICTTYTEVEVYTIYTYIVYEMTK